MSAGLVKLNYSVRKFTDDSVDVSDLSGLLSPFQIEKLSYLFKCLDQTGNGYIDVRQWIILLIQLYLSTVSSGGRYQSPRWASPEYRGVGEGRPQVPLDHGQQPCLPGVYAGAGSEGEEPQPGDAELGGGTPPQQSLRHQCQPQELAQHVVKAVQRVRGGLINE